VLSKPFAFTLLVTMALAATASATTIVNGSFEQPAIGGSFQYNPVDPTGAWTFNGRSGIANSTFFAPPPPDGTQAAFLQQFVDQGNSLSSITQTLTAVAPGDIISFYLAQRPGFNANPVTVSYNGTTLGTFTPGSTAFVQFSVHVGAVAASSGVLAFTSTVPTTGDLDTAIDLVTSPNSSRVPEPSTAVLWISGLGLVGLVGFRRHCN
jgi:PEP-CTERM motif